MHEKRRTFTWQILLPFALLLVQQAGAQIPQNPNQFNARGVRTGYWTLLYADLWDREVRDTALAENYLTVLFVDGKPAGKALCRYKTGELLWEGELFSVDPPTPQDGYQLFHHRNGNPRLVATYANGRVNGLLSEYFENGRKASEIAMRSAAASARRHPSSSLISPAFASSTEAKVTFPTPYCASVLSAVAWDWSRRPSRYSPTLSARPRMASSRSPTRRRRTCSIASAPCVSAAGRPPERSACP